MKLTYPSEAMRAWLRQVVAVFPGALVEWPRGSRRWRRMKREDSH